MSNLECVPRYLRLVVSAVAAIFPFIAVAQDTKPPVKPAAPATAVKPESAAVTPPATPPAQPAPATPLPGLRATKPSVKDTSDPAPLALPTQPGKQPEPLFIPEIPNPDPRMPLPPIPGGMAPVFMNPMQREYSVGKFVIKYGTDMRARNPKLPTEAELSASVVSLLEARGKLFHIAKRPSAGMAMPGSESAGVTAAQQPQKDLKSDDDLALNPPGLSPLAPASAPGVKPEAKPDTKPDAKPDAKLDTKQKKEAARAERNAPKVIPKPAGTRVNLKVSDFGTPRTISAMALLDVYNAVVKKLTDRGLIGIYLIADVNPSKQTEQDVRPVGVLDVNVTVFISEVAKIRTIARKIPSRVGDLPKINDEDAPDGRTVKDPKHLWIKDKSPAFVFKAKKGGGLLEKPRLQEYLSRLNRFPGRRVDVAINATGEKGKVMLDYLIREQKRFMIYAQESNNGTKSTGEWRSRLGVELRQLANKDDILRLEYTTSDLEQYNAAILSYQFALIRPDVLKMRFYGMYGNYSAQDVGFAGLNFKGESITAGAALTWTPIYWHSFPLDITVGGEFMRSTVESTAANTNSAVDFVLPYFAVGTDRTTEKFSLAANFQVKGSFASQDQTQLNGLGRFGVDGAFWILNGDVSASIFLEPLLMGKRWGDFGDGTKWWRGMLANELAVIAHGQYALGNRRLVPQLQMLAGGYNTVRGYPEFFTTGDSGFVTSLEYRLHVPRLFKPADAVAKGKKTKAGKIANTAGKPKPSADSQLPAQPEPQMTSIGERGESRATKFQLRPGTAGAGADWDFMIRTFLDYGQVFNNRIVSSVEQNRTLMSTGVGIELQLFKPIFATIRADYGYVLQSQTRLLADPVNAGDNRLHISVTIAW